MHSFMRFLFIHQQNIAGSLQSTGDSSEQDRPWLCPHGACVLEGETASHLTTSSTFDYKLRKYYKGKV